MTTTIRLAQPSDAKAFQEIYGPVVETTPISFETEVPSVDELAARVRATLEVAPWLACEAGGRVLGYAYAARHRERAAYRWSVDVSVYVRDGWRGAGVGRALYHALFPLLAWQGYAAAHAGITLPNAASVGLHEAMGFRLVGVYEKVGFKAGRWHDVGWWQRPLRPREGEPGPIRTVDALRRDPAWALAVADGARLVRLP